MIHIDGSFGEGGGQILRSAIALSIVTHTPVTIDNIRANRSTPGLKPQHYAVISLLSKLSQAETKGVAIGSSSVSFSPGPLRGGRFHVDVGTAGSIVLVAQAILLATMNTTNKIIVELVGGTDVKWAPSWDYFNSVFLPFISNLGLIAQTTIQKRGYYPKGGGKMNLTIIPSDARNRMNLERCQIKKSISGIVHSSLLPDHIPTRMRDIAVSCCQKRGYHCQVSIDQNQSRSPGVVLTLFVQNDGCYVGRVGLGERGVSAESIGSTCSNEIIDILESESTVDPFLCDQVLGFLACTPHRSILRTTSVSSHAKTNMWLIEHFFENQSMFDLIDQPSTVKVRVNGPDFR